MARGFGSVYGVDVNDKITTSLTQNATQRTFAVWCYAQPGSTSTGRVFDKTTTTASELVFLDSFNSVLRYSRWWNGSEVSWSTPIPQAERWFHYLLTYDSSSTSEVPRFYVDGWLRATSAFSGTATGSPVNNADAYIVGNRATGARVATARLAEAAIWDEILTPDEILLLARGEKMPSQIRRPRLYLPLLGDTNEPDYSGYGSAQTVGGTKVRDHPPAIKHLWHQPINVRRYMMANSAPAVGHPSLAGPRFGLAGPRGLAA